MKKLSLIILFLISFIAISQTPCPSEGTGKNNKEKLSNKKKNRDINLSHIDTRIDLNYLLQDGEDSNRLSEDSSIVVYGYCVEVKKGGIESCNCGSTLDSTQNIQMYIGFYPKASKDECMLVTFTPKFKRVYTNFNANDYIGHVVKVYGYLFYDEEHKNNAKNTCVKCTDTWRKTCWEIHPVVKIDFIK